MLIRRTTRHTPGTRRSSPAGGFTLLETSLATVIIGVGVLAIIEAQQTFIRTNAWSTHASTATYLANEIREMTRTYPRHDRFTGGLYFTDPEDAETMTGWGTEDGEVTAADLDDLDDLDGAVFGNATDFPEGFVMTTRYPGPINAFGDVIPETRWDGTVATIEVEGEEQTLPMAGWTQIVQVEKVDPQDYSTAVESTTVLVSDDGDVVRGVGRYPLRITVTILYQGDFDAEAPPVTTVSWIVPP